jgi:hypothetical protein
MSGDTVTDFADLFGRRPHLTTYEIPLEENISVTIAVQRKHPQVSLVKMYGNLIQYAQAFERNDAIRRDMDADFNAVRGRWCLGYKYTYSDRSPCNPYVETPSHPVEGGLAEACVAFLDNEVDDFIRAREAVLKYLDGQYQRIAAAAQSMAAYFKDNNIGVVGECPFEHAMKRSWSPRGLCASTTECTVLLEDYCQSLVRDLTPQVKIRIEESGLKYSNKYVNTERNTLFAALKVLVRGDRSAINSNEFLAYVQRIVRDLDEQYLNIRAARLALFEHDNPDAHDRGVDIDLELGCQYEAISFPRHTKFFNPLTTYDDTKERASKWNNSWDTPGW